MRLRVHHLLCSALYVGKGYSEAFCGNMQRIVWWLWEEPDHVPERDKEAQGARNGRPGDGEKRKIRLVSEPDNICSACPNLGEGGCKLDDDRVVSKDEALAQALALETERVYSVTELLGIVGRNLTEEIFETSCHNCEWYAQGLCSYEALADRYRERETHYPKEISAEKVSAGFGKALNSFGT